MQHSNDSLKNKRAKNNFLFRLGENTGQFLLESDSPDKLYEISTMLEFVLNNYLKKNNET